MQARAVSGSSTVPAPSTILSPNWSASFSSARIAPGTVMVISAARTPPRCIASMARIAPSALDVRTTGTIPISLMKERICCEVILIFCRAVQGDAAEEESARVDLAVTGAAEQGGEVVDGDEASQRIGNIGIDAWPPVKQCAPKGAVQKKIA